MAVCPKRFAPLYVLTQPRAAILWLSFGTISSHTFTPQFPHLQSGTDNNMAWLEPFDEITYAKCVHKWTP